jgi:type I restriction enzyme S subunit
MLITDTLGRVTRNFYDTTGRLISTTANDLPGHEPNYLNQYNLNTVYGYDESGRQYLVTNTLGFANHTAYDPVTGRPLTTTTNYADGVFDPAVPDEDVAQSTEYDVHGNPYLRRDAGIIALKRAQANLKRYKAAVLKAACEGKLVEQDASDEPASELLARILAERRAKWEDDLRAKGKDPKKAKYEEPKSPDLDELPELPSGWCWVTLDQMMHFMTSGSRGWAKYYAESGALFVRVGNFNRLSITLDLQNPTFVDAPQGAEADRTRLQLNDLLITMTADVGMIGIVDERALQWEEAYINQHVGLVRLVFAELLQFVSWALASESVQVQFLKKQYGATKLGLGFEEVKSIHMPLPPLIEQRRIVAEVERRLSVVQELEGTLTANLARVERLRQAILKRAFEGRLVGR